VVEILLVSPRRDRDNIVDIQIRPTAGRGGEHFANQRRIRRVGDVILPSKPE